MWQKKLAAARTNSSPKPFPVVGKNAFFLKALGKTLQQHIMGFAACRGQTIVHPQSIFPGNHQSGFAQIGQVPGGRGLRDIQYGNKMADAQFSTLKQIENPQPSSVGQCAKNRLRLGLGSLGLHIRLHEYIGCPPSGQELELGKRQSRSGRAQGNALAKGEDFEKKENQLFGDGGFEKNVARVEAIEKTLGIYDLALFTPLLPMDTPL